jgi:hypothetical protein
MVMLICIQNVLADIRLLTVDVADLSDYCSLVEFDVSHTLMFIWYVWCMEYGDVPACALSAAVPKFSRFFFYNSLACFGVHSCSET